MAINVHNIENSQKVSTSLGSQKIDLMTMENGMFANNLNRVVAVLENQCSENNRIEALKIVLECFVMNKIKIRFERSNI